MVCVMEETYRDQIKMSLIPTTNQVQAFAVLYKELLIIILKIIFAMGKELVLGVGAKASQDHPRYFLQVHRNR